MAMAERMWEYTDLQTTCSISKTALQQQSIGEQAPICRSLENGKKYNQKLFFNIIFPTEMQLEKLVNFLPVSQQKNTSCSDTFSLV
jgi:hypothetical protein